MILSYWLQSVPYMQISDMIAGVDIIGGKVSVASAIGVGGYGDVLTQQQGVLGGGAH